MTDSERPFPAPGSPVPPGTPGLSLPTAESVARDAAEKLSLTVHDAPPPEQDLAATTRRGGRLMMLLILAVCAAPVIASYLMYYVVRPHLRTTNYATLVEPQRPMPSDLGLRTLDGRPVDVASLRRQWLIVVVGSSRCDVACEKRLFLQRQLREMAGADRDRVDKLWLVDDAPGQEGPVRDYVRSVFVAAPNTTVLRADREALLRWLPADTGHAIEDHVYLVDPMGNLMMRAPADPDPAKLKKDLERLLNASASWDTPGR
jgi:cytochrome oxidase Cu insertion factor (SCO1/SenC/PrrC family)